MGRPKSDLLTYGRKLHDIGRVFVEAVHDAEGNDEDAERIFKDPLRRQIAQLIMGKLKLDEHPSDSLAAEYGLTVVDNEDVEPTVKSVADLELVYFLKPNDDGRITGQVMRQRAVTLKANLGLSDAKYLLDHQSEISPEFRGKVLVFVGTLLRGSNGRLYVAGLYWDDGRWCLDFYWLDDDWRGGFCLARCKSAAL
jgi:hypothetical protein